ncbi:prepilin-type N-terminal cleavage/methylation domain-containing protein [Methylotuvimicrobium sp. KM2]|uniref:type IV pilus modification PilV family protein n=1 Tax=Methylotuvimicrobium sp. KM2 TaxID=3133976 RepID=UPI003100F477
MQNKTQGFSLIEALIAALIVGVGMLGLAKLQGEMFIGSTDSRMRTHAQNAAQAIIEDFRSFAHQSTYATFANGSDVFTPVGSNAQFSRSWTVTVCPNTVNCKQIQVTVTWTDSRNNLQTVNLTSYIAEADPVKSGVVLAEMTPASPPSGGEGDNGDGDTASDGDGDTASDGDGDTASDGDGDTVSDGDGNTPAPIHGGGRLTGNKSNCVSSITLTGTGGTASCTPGSNTYSCSITYSSGSTEFQGILKATISGSGCSNAVACVGGTLISGDSAGHNITITPTTTELPAIAAQNNNC